MTSKTWVSGTVIDSAWLQDTNDWVYKGKDIPGIHVVNVKASPYLAVGNGVTDDTAAIQAAINVIKATGRGGVVVIPPGNYLISSSLNMGDATTQPSGLCLIGDGMPSITCNNKAVPIITVSGAYGRIENLILQYDSLPNNTFTNAVGIRGYHYYYSTLRNLNIYNTYAAIDQAPSAGLPGYNSWFSNTHENLIIQVFSKWGVSLVPFLAGNSGNLWNNTYISNRTAGANQSCSGGLNLSVSDDGVFNQLNLEWMNASGPLVVLNQAGNIVFNGVHMEGNNPAAAAAFTALIDVVGGSAGATPIFDGITVKGNDWTGVGGINRLGLFRVDNSGIKISAKGIVSSGNTNPTYTLLSNTGGATSYGSTIRVESCVDIDGSFSTNERTPKVSLGTPDVTLPYPIQQFNNVVEVPPVTLTYSASISTTASAGNTFLITATNGTAFTINTPTNAVTDKKITYVISNTSGGALGAVTWTGFKMAAWTSPATGFNRSITFRYNGTNWVEVSRTTTDVPN